MWAGLLLGDCPGLSVQVMSPQEVRKEVSSLRGEVGAAEGCM